MARDKIENRFSKRQMEHQLQDLANRGRSKEEIDAEKELIKKTEKVQPIRAEGRIDRNAPCPCGSGKKYKKCCGAKTP